MDAGLMIVREDVEKFITIEECTKSSDSYGHEAGLFHGRGRLRALELRNGDAALIRPYRHGGLFRHLLNGIFLLGRRGLFRVGDHRRGPSSRCSYSGGFCRLRQADLGAVLPGLALVTRQLKGGQDLWTAIRDGFVGQTGAEKVFNGAAASLRGLHRGYLSSRSEPEEYRRASRTRRSEGVYHRL